MAKRDVFIRNVDAETWDEFRTVVAQKEQKLHGVLGKAVTEALRLYIDLMRREGGTHTHKTQNHEKPKSRTMKTLTQIADRITSEYEKEVPQTEVERIITQVAGGDDRTLRKYTRLLIEHGVLEIDRPIAGTIPLKFIFRVNGHANRIG